MKPDIKPNNIEREHTNLCSRRRFVGGMATGIIAASATLASQESSHASGQFYGVSGGSGNP